MYKHGHWTCDYKIDTKTSFGFVYLIICKPTGRMYIGKKQFHSYKKKKIYKESDWKTYTSSSTDLNEDIKKYGKDSFIFKILNVYKTRGGLVYGEANLQHKYDVLTQRDLEGNRLWYNRQIGSIKFIPKEYYP